MPRRSVFNAEGAAVASALVRYQGIVLPRVRRELAGWRDAAASIPDPNLRSLALEALTDKASNPEAIGVLACLAPRRSRPTVIRASTALQVAIDYLDSVEEQPGTLPLNDGGYLSRLTFAWEQAAGALPSAEALLPVAQPAIGRCIEGQNHTHAAAQGSPQALREWASRLTAPADYEWWEIAAGASSSVAAHAVLALAAFPEASREQGELVDAAYFPSIGALTVLLDDLVDCEADRAGGEHSYLRYYPSEAVAAERLETIIGLARESVQPLPQPALHGAILSGVLAFYLSSPGAAAPGARTIRDHLLISSGPVVRSLTRILELRDR